MSEAFFALVEKTDSCWLWTGKRGETGYGYVPKALRDPRNQEKIASRFSWVLHFGPIHGGLFVCHRCDNPPCVRPEHLYLGTHEENMRDAGAKGHLGRPREHLESPLARWMAANRVTYRALAAKSGFTLHRIFSVASGSVPRADAAVRISEATGGAVTVEDIAFPNGRFSGCAQKNREIESQNSQEN